MAPFSYFFMLFFINIRQITSGSLKVREKNHCKCTVFCLSNCIQPTIAVPTHARPTTSPTRPPTIIPSPLRTTRKPMLSPIREPNLPALPPTTSPILPPPTSSPPPKPPTPPTNIPPSSQPTGQSPPVVPTSKPVATTAMPTIPGELSCEVPLQKIGCFKDDQKTPRPLPEYILTDRDKSMTKIYSGIDVNWGDWINYLPDLVCRCARLANSKSYKYFGIQYYGECWSGPSTDENKYKRNDVSTECVDTEWQSPCNDNTKIACSGKQNANYVYAII